MRISSALALLLLAGCEQAKTDRATLARVEAGQRRNLDDDGRLLCAQGDAALVRACTVERTTSAAGLILTLRHPDGAFHRLLVTNDGRGVVAADGAEAASVAVVGADRIDVALGGSRYRLPATVRAAPATAR